MINKINLNNIINTCIKLKKKKVKIKLNKSDLKYLNFFINLNIITLIKRDCNNLYYLYFNTNFAILKILNFIKPGNKKIIKLKQLVLFNLKNKNLFFLSTPKGILINTKAQELKQGGLILFYLIIKTN